MALSEFQTLNKRLGIPHMERRRGVSVTLRRSGVSTDSFDARRQDLRFTTAGSGIVDARVRWREYLLPIASVVLDGTTTRPHPGDLVYEGTGKWKVAAPNDDTPAVEEHENGNDWRVHVRSE